MSREQWRIVTQKLSWKIFTIIETWNPFEKINLKYFQKLNYFSFFIKYSFYSRKSSVNIVSELDAITSIMLPLVVNFALSRHTSHPNECYVLRNTNA